MRSVELCLNSNLKDAFYSSFKNKILNCSNYCNCLIFIIQYKMYICNLHFNVFHRSRTFIQFEIITVKRIWLKQNLFSESLKTVINMSTIVWLLKSPLYVFAIANTIFLRRIINMSTILQLLKYICISAVYMFINLRSVINVSTIVWMIKSFLFIFAIVNTRILTCINNFFLE